MFLVEDHYLGADYLVFTAQDPKRSGFDGPVTSGVTLEYDYDAVHLWPDGHARPEARVGRSPDDPNYYKVFKYGSDLRAVNYQPVPGTPLVFGSWDDYTRLRLTPPDPDRTDEMDWFDYLDNLDETTRRRRKRPEVMPKSAGRDDVAAWVARNHFIVDTAVREVWYLPHGAPADEIRLLEVNDRMAGPDGPTRPQVSGVDVDGADFRLAVADVTTEQLDRLSRDPAHLPSGWTLDGHTVWRRRP